MSSSKSARAGAIGVECITLILSVDSLPASIRYYLDVLGLKVDWGNEGVSDMASPLGLRNAGRGP